MNFEELGIIKRINDSLLEKNYTEATPIQEKTIPIALKSKDILASAQTGTGKTAAFSLPIIQHLQNSAGEDDKRKIRALILTPTRELAIQISDNVKIYSKFTKVNQTVIFGGVSQARQVKALQKGIDILIATPGRLIDLINQRIISLRDIEHFVLDEADRMLDMGFIHDVNKIIDFLPPKRQSYFFSATLPEKIISLSETILKDPVKIEVDVVSSAAETVQQKVYFTNKSEKRKLLFEILEDDSIDHVLIFTRTKHGADRLNRELKKKKILCEAIHGDKAQNQRQNALNKFKNNELRALVATDIAARGLDINQLPFVINYEIPEVAETYVHRIGRTGRAGKSGVSISMVEPEENKLFSDIETLIGKKVEVVNDHSFPQTDKPMTKKEKAEYEKGKQERRKEYFENKKKKEKRVKNQDQRAKNKDQRKKNRKR